MTNAEDPNIGEFLKHGKLLTYVGGADVLIPTYSTTYYRKLVADALGNDNLDDTYRTFIGEDPVAFPAQASSWANGSLSFPQLRVSATALAAAVPTDSEVLASVKTASADSRSRSCTMPTTT